MASFEAKCAFSTLVLQCQIYKVYRHSRREKTVSGKCVEGTHATTFNDPFADGETESGSAANGFGREEGLAARPSGFLICGVECINGHPRAGSRLCCTNPFQSTSLCRHCVGGSLRWRVAAAAQNAILNVDGRGVQVAISG